MNKKERITIIYFKNHPTFTKSITWHNEYSELTIYSFTNEFKDALTIPKKTWNKFIKQFL